MCQHKIAIIIGILSVIFIVGIIACNRDSVSPLEFSLGTYYGTYKIIQNYNLSPNQQTVLIDTMRFIFRAGNVFQVDDLDDLPIDDSCTSLGTFLYKPDSLKIIITEDNLFEKVCNLAPGGDYKLIDNKGDSLIYGALSEDRTVYQRIALQGR
ncbi:MAG: hypothetical protein NTV06_06965 [candidate division Zixibacteria bacterium]|nr:hypothetical protein [candidate division Zixibacteria bacterium]